MVFNKEEIIEIIENNKREIKKCGVKSIKLFGSFTVDKQNEVSDIDLLVEFEKGRGLFKDMSNLRILLEKVLKRPIDLVKPNLIRKELRPYILEGKQIEARI